MKGVRNIFQSVDLLSFAEAVALVLVEEFTAPVYPNLPCVIPHPSPKLNSPPTKCLLAHTPIVYSLFSNNLGYESPLLPLFMMIIINTYKLTPNPLLYTSLVWVDVLHWGQKSL